MQEDFEASIVIHTWNFNTQEAEVGGPEVWRPVSKSEIKSCPDSTGSEWMEYNLE